MVYKQKIKTQAKIHETYQFRFSFHLMIQAQTLLLLLIHTRLRLFQYTQLIVVFYTKMVVHF